MLVDGGSEAEHKANRCSQDLHSVQSCIEDNKVDSNVVADRDILENSYCGWVDALIHASTQVLLYEVCCVYSSQL